MSRSLYKGEIDMVGIEVSRKDQQEFSLGAATYEVRDARHKVVKEDSATVEGRKVYSLIDTTEEHYRPGQAYYVYFVVEIEGRPERKIGPVEVHILR